MKASTQPKYLYQAMFLMFIVAVGRPGWAQGVSLTDGGTPPGIAPGAPAGTYPLSGFDDALNNGEVLINNRCGILDGRRGRVWVTGDGTAATFISDVDFYDNPYERRPRRSNEGTARERSWASAVIIITAARQDQCVSSRSTTRNGRKERNTRARNWPRTARLCCAPWVKPGNNRRERRPSRTGILLRGTRRPIIRAWSRP